MPKHYINIHGEPTCAQWSKWAFQDVANSGDIKSLKGLTQLERDIQAGVLKDGDVVQVWVRITTQKDEAAGKGFSYAKTDGSTAESVVAGPYSPVGEIPF